MLGCHALSNLLLDQLFETMPFDKAELEVHLVVYNRLRARADDQEVAGDAEQALASREEALQILSFILQATQAQSLSQLVKYEMRCEKATLLEVLGRLEEARQEYLATIDDLERSRGWMGDPEQEPAGSEKISHVLLRASRAGWRAGPPECPCHRCEQNRLGQGVPQPAQCADPAQPCAEDRPRGEVQHRVCHGLHAGGGTCGAG